MMANEKLYHVRAVERTEIVHRAEVYANGDADVREKIIDGDIIFDEPTVIRGDIEFEIREVHRVSVLEKPAKECCDGQPIATNVS